MRCCLSRPRPYRAEVVLESERTRVTRLFGSRRTVIRKEPLGPDAQRRLRYELAVLERLRGVVGVAQVLDEPRYPGSITLADAGDASLAVVVKPLEVDQLIGLAAGLAAAVAGMHGRGVMHRDICPTNVVISSDCAPCLVVSRRRRCWQSYARSSLTTPKSLGRCRIWRPSRPDVPVGRWIIAPICTRWARHCMSWPPESRRSARRIRCGSSMMLWRVCSTPAVRDQSPVPRITVGDHHASAGKGARRPLPVGERGDPRHSAVGRTRCRRQRPQRGSVSATFRCACWRRRGSSAATTSWSRYSAAFEDALTGRCRGVLVSGAPGVGKTALVDQLRPVVTGNDGWFVAGKFDQYRQDLEFDGIFQAFHALGRLLLAEPEDELAELRERILAALGPNAGMVAAARAGVLGAAWRGSAGRRSADRPRPGAAQRSGNATCGGLAETTGDVVHRRPAVGEHPPLVGVIDLAFASRWRACCWWLPTVTSSTRRIRFRRHCRAGDNSPA